MTDKNKEKSGFIEIRNDLKTEFERFASINTVLKDTSDGFNQIDHTYNNYGSEMDIAKNHIIKLKRREFFENLFIYIGLVIFFICVAYVMLKRFPLHRIIFFIYNILEYIMQGVISLLGKVLIKSNLANSVEENNLNNTIYINNYNKTDF